jgi:hypothetical protein
MSDSLSAISSACGTGEGVDRGNWKGLCVGAESRGERARHDPQFPSTEVER